MVTQEQPKPGQDMSGISRIPTDLSPDEVSKDELGLAEGEGHGEVAPEDAAKDAIGKEKDEKDIDMDKKKGKLSRIVKRVKKKKETAEELKDLEEVPHIKEIEFIPIQEPFSYVKITLNELTNEYVYNIFEPALTSREKRYHEFIVETLSRVVNYDEDLMSNKKERDERLTNTLTEDFKNILDDYGLELSEETEGKILYYIIRDYVGYGKVDVIMKDAAVEDVSCDGPEIPVFIYHRELGSVKTNVVYDTEEELESFE